MILLIGGIAFIGAQTADNTEEEFKKYRQLAQLNVAAGNSVTLMGDAVYNVNRFINANDTAAMQVTLAKLQDLGNVLDKMSSLARAQETITLLAQAKKSLSAYTSLLKPTQESVLGSYESYKNLAANIKTMTAAAQQISVLAHGAKNSEVLFYLAGIANNIANVEGYAGQYVEKRSSDEAALTKKAIADITKQLPFLSENIQTAKGLAAFDVMLQSFATVEKAFADVEAKTTATEKYIVDARAMRNNFVAGLDEINKIITTSAKNGGEKLQAETAAAHQTTMIFGIVGVLLGVLLATFIAIHIVRLFGKLSQFASAIAQANFEEVITIKEKGEVGVMVTALQSIPAVLNKTMEKANELTRKVMRGDYRARIDAADFQNGYARLVNMFNAVSDSYTNVLDIVPVPVMSCNKDLVIQFLNKPAQGAVGGNHCGDRCGKHLCADACGNEQCLGRQTMQRKKPYTNETVVRPLGARMDVSVTAAPLLDEQGEIVGYIELLTDLTEIKSKQNTILRVAEQAADIAHRVAAASEELSAQVEQVSRGAETQRTRVESTASAMTEMSATVLEVANNAGKASEQSEQTKDRANDGSNLVSRVAHSINEVNKITTALHGQMQELGQQTKNIGNVMNVISDIADQTNLLALNAAIEAARAGEAGRGFAVVADEVRKLAEKTMNATQEVGSSITAAQCSAQTSIKSVAEAAEAIEEVTSLTDSSRGALAEIVDLASSSSSTVASIATAAEEQSATSEEINRAINEINVIVGENTSGMVQASEAIQELSRMAQELNRVISELHA